MGLSFRKSKKKGPFRVNLSKSGVGWSYGAGGVRVSHSSRGTQFSASKNGVTYRKKISDKKSNQGQSNEDIYYDETLSTVEDDPFEDIVTAESENLTNSGFEDFVHALKKKQKNFIRIRPFLNIFILSGLAAFILPKGTAETIMDVICFLAAIGLLTFCINDLFRGRVKVEYILDDDSDRINTLIQSAIGALNECSCVYALHGKIEDFSQIDAYTGKSSVSIFLKSPRIIKANVPSSHLLIGKQTFCFLPDRIVVLDKSSAGAIDYRDCEMLFSTVTLHRLDFAPSDAKIVGQTWEHSNKDGSPDRRFKENKSLYDIKFGAINIKSTDGVNIFLLVSNIEQMQKFESFFKDVKESLQSSQTKLSESSPAPHLA